MKKNIKLILYIIFALTISFTFVESYNAGTHTVKVKKCIYSYGGCGYTVKFEPGNGVYDWRTEISAPTNPSSTKKCGTFNGTKVYALVMDKSLKNNEVKKILKDGNCKNLYLGKKLVDCSDYLTNAYKNKKCFILYGSDGGYNRKVIKPDQKDETEEKTNGSASKGGGDTNNKDDDEKENVEYKIEVLSKIKVADKYTSCKQLLSDDVIRVLNRVFLIIRILVPFLLIVLSMKDYAVLITKNEDKLKETTMKFIKRMIAALLVFLAPTLINFLMNITGISDGTCGLG